MENNKNKLSLQKGVALIEFTFIVPVFLILMLGMAEMGFAFFDKAVITNAAREGARAGIVVDVGKTFATAKVLAESRARAYCAGNLISLGEGATACTAVAIPRSCDNSVGGGDPPVFGTPLCVTVTYTYRGLWLTSLIGLVGNDIVLTSGVTMFNE